MLTRCKNPKISTALGSWMRRRSSKTEQSRRRVRATGPTPWVVANLAAELQMAWGSRVVPAPTPFLISTGRMKTPDLLNAATGNSQFFTPKWGDVREEFLFWIQCVDSVLADKTEAMDKPNYQPCDQYWLLLRDEMTGDHE
jgi:hypothetical protein